MVYKISDKAIIIESDGETILIAEDLQYEESITILNTDGTLSPTYITDYFATPIQGSISGHSVGGYPPYGPNNSIDKFSFVSDANATDVGDILQTSLKRSAGTSTLSEGYISGGSTSPIGPPYTDIDQNVIQKFSFASGGNTTDVGDLSSTSFENTGLTDKSGDQSFIYQTKYPYATTSYLKFPFATGVTSSAGTVLYHKSSKSEQVSTTHGYTTGGKNIPPEGDVSIEKFAFASDGDATDVGDMSFDTYGAGGTESENHGYTFGGVIPSPYSFYNNIDKFPFATDANGTDVGDLTVARYNRISGSGSTTHGYGAAGRISVGSNIIDKWPFSSDANATDVGDLTFARFDGHAGQLQV